MEYRNPNEAVRFLKRVQSAMHKIINYSSVAIVTASASKGRVKVVDLQKVEPTIQHTPTKSAGTKRSIRHSVHKISIPRMSSFQSGDYQDISDDERKYRQTFSLYHDLKTKEVEWKSLWSDNPHLDKLLKELSVTQATIREALLSLRRKLSSFTMKYCPTKLLNMATDIELSIKEFNYSKLSTNKEVTFPNENDSNIVHFKFKYKISNLKTHNVKVIPTYIIVVTFVVDILGKSAECFLTTMMENEPNAELGGSFSNTQEALDLLHTYLDLDKIDLDVVGVLPFPEIPSLNKESLESEYVASVDIDPDTKRLYVRTSKFLPDAEQEELLYSIMRHIPEHLRSGQLRVDVGVEAFVTVGPITDRTKRAEVVEGVAENFENAQMRSVAPSASSDLEFFIKTLSFRVANQEVPKLKRYLARQALVIRSDKSSYGVRNVFSFAVGAGKRSDLRALRTFVDNISEEFEPEVVLKIRRALGI